MDTYSERLKAERERLGFTQEQFAALAGMKKNAQLNYEKGLRKPDLDYLKAIHAAGADVKYIIAGDRISERDKSPDVDLMGEEAAVYAGGLSPVAELVVLFEKAPKHLQQAVMTILRGE